MPLYCRFDDIYNLHQLTQSILVDWTNRYFEKKKKKNFRFVPGRRRRLQRSSTESLTPLAQFGARNTGGQVVSGADRVTL